jgi:hypothetical protein
MTGNMPVVNDYTPNQSGGLQFFYKNAASPFHDTSQINISGSNGLFYSGVNFTGVRTIRLYTPKVLANSTQYFGAREIEFY